MGRKIKKIDFEKYKERALAEARQLDKILKIDALYLCVSRCYYTVLSLLGNREIEC